MKAKVVQLLDLNNTERIFWGIKIQKSDGMLYDMWCTSDGETQYTTEDKKEAIKAVTTLNSRFKSDIDNHDTASLSLN